jgi:hypothetical protein
MTLRMKLETGLFWPKVLHWPSLVMSTVFPGWVVQSTLL